MFYGRGSHATSTNHYNKHLTRPNLIEINNTNTTATTGARAGGYSNNVKGVGSWQKKASLMLVLLMVGFMALSVLLWNLLPPPGSGTSTTISRPNPSIHDGVSFVVPVLTTGHQDWIWSESEIADFVQTHRGGRDDVAASLLHRPINSTRSHCRAAMNGAALVTDDRGTVQYATTRICFIRCSTSSHQRLTCAIWQDSHVSESTRALYRIAARSCNRFGIRASLASQSLSLWRIVTHGLWHVASTTNCVSRAAWLPSLLNQRYYCAEWRARSTGILLGIGGADCVRACVRALLACLLVIVEVELDPIDRTKKQAPLCRAVDGPVRCMLVGVPHKLAIA
jgi:hypothetical protein